MMQNRLCFKNTQPSVVRRALAGAHIPEGLIGKKLLFIADIHAGKWFDRAATEQLIRDMRALSADLVLIGGDLADNQADEQMAIHCLSKLTAPMGVYAVPGNNDHEAFGGDYAPFRAMLKAAGIRLLFNERAELPVPGGRLIISGLDETKHGRPDKGVLAFDRRAGDFHILLTHSPWALDGVMASSTADLALCGHTHGGQMTLFGLTPFTLGYERKSLKKRRYFFVSGDHTVDDMRVIVSNGVGFSLMPIRLNAPPEVELIAFGRGP